MTSVRRRRNSRLIAYSVLMLVIVIKVVESNIQYDFRVELQKYENKFNLKYRPDSIDTPYCCCAKRSDCFSSITDTNLTTSSCLAQCPLRFTLMANLSWFEGIGSKEEGMITPNNFVSSFYPGLFFINFDCPSDGKNFFPNQNKYPQFTFPVNIPSPNDFNNISLMVKIEEGNEDIDVEFVDIVDVPIAKKGFVDSDKYIGEHGIATITLGYSFIAIIDDSSSSIHQQDAISPTASPMMPFKNALLLSRPGAISFTNTITMLVTEQVSFTNPPLLCPTETISFTKTVTMLVPEQASTKSMTTTEVMEESHTWSAFLPSNSCESSTSSSVLMPVSVALITIATMMFLAAILITSATVFWKWRKKMTVNEKTNEGLDSHKNIVLAGNQAYQAVSFEGSQTGTAETSGFSLESNPVYETV